MAADATASFAQATLQRPATDRQQLMLDTHRSTHAAMGRVRRSMREEHALLIQVRRLCPGLDPDPARRSVTVPCACHCIRR